MSGAADFPLLSFGRSTGLGNMKIGCLALTQIRVANVGQSLDLVR